MQVQLGSINYWLRKLGLVLTVITDPQGIFPTLLRFERASSYDRRVRR